MAAVHHGPLPQLSNSPCRYVNCDSWGGGNRRAGDLPACGTAPRFTSACRAASGRCDRMRTPPKLVAGHNFGDRGPSFFELFEGGLDCHRRTPCIVVSAFTPTIAWVFWPIRKIGELGWSSNRTFGLTETQGDKKHCLVIDGVATYSVQVPDTESDRSSAYRIWSKSCQGKDHSRNRGNQDRQRESALS